ncbi:MAG: RluA family pseudouridine synthase [Clostridia bacterium]|nr:RluA family pseudouridine synthase [Clostridia bacterium]
MEILYEDDRLWLCVKPVGLSSEENGERPSVPLYLKQQGAVYVGTVHRLDVVTGGVMVYAKDPASAAALSAAFAEGKADKEYLAVIEGKPEKTSDTLTDQLFHDRRSGKSFAVSRPRKGAKEAILDYTLLETVETPKGFRSLLRIRLHTGRTHQIRAQFASRKLPLCGDGRYGGRDNACSPALWCHSLSVANVKGISLPPDQYPWNLFSGISAL